MRPTFPFLLFAFICSTAAAQPKPADVSAALNVTALQSGKDATLVVTIDIPRGLHAQSHTPTDKENGVPFLVKLQPDPAVEWLDPAYPAGEDVEYPAVGKLNVYTGRVPVPVPLRAKADAPLGPITLAGSVRYQACDENTCYPPETVKFQVQTKIVSASEKVQPNFTFKPMRPEGSDWSIGVALGAALLAGLAFNIMPCVLPVLPLKIIGFYEVAQHRRARSFALGLVFSAGIIAVFVALAVVVIALQAIAWGDLFQRGWFIWSVAIFLALMAAGMFGLFEVQLPASLYGISPRHDTWGGNFAFGALTAVLATPCAAPLLPGVLGFATTRDPKWLGVLAVIVVGVGMALPYAILSAVPEVARRLPRAGPAAGLFKQMLGFMLLAAAVFFAGGRLFGGPSFWWVIVAVVAIAAIYLVARTVRITSRIGPVAAVSVLAVAMLVGIVWWTAQITGLFLPSRASAAASTQPGAKDEGQWVSYSPEKLNDALAAHKTVLVKFTANWCANCQVIEGRVFGDPAVWREMDRLGVVAMKVDLTDPPDGDPGRKLLLQLNPAGGIPLMAIFSPNSSTPTQPANQYSKESILEALRQASGS